MAKAKKAEITVIKGQEEQVDALYDLTQQIESIESKASVIVDSVKEVAKGNISGFGTVNMNGSKAYFQVSVKRPTVTLDTEAIGLVIKLVGIEDANLLFDITTTGNEIVPPDKLADLQAFITNHGGNPKDFIVPERKASARDAVLNEKLFSRIVPDEDTRKKIFLYADAKGMGAKPSGGFKVKKDEE
jgi:hypothetical protein